MKIKIEIEIDVKKTAKGRERIPGKIVIRPKKGKGSYTRKQKHKEKF